MDKREEFDREPEYDFDPNEILDDETDGGSDLLSSLEALTVDDSDLDDILSDDFLASLGIGGKLSNEDSAEEDPAEEEIDEFNELLDEDDDAAGEEYTEEESSDDQTAEADTEAEDEADEEADTDDALISSEDILAVFQEDDGDDRDVQPYIAAPGPAFDVESELGEEFTAAFEKDFPSAQEDENDQAVVPVVEVSQEEKQAQLAKRKQERRKKMSMERTIKEVYLPPAILLLTAILLITFIGGAIGRAVKAGKDREEAIQASKDAVSSALEAEANQLAQEALTLAAGYNYDAALAKLDSFSADKLHYQQLLDAYNTITQAKDKVKPVDDPNQIPNLSFHCLIADPTRAFIDKDWGKSYNQNYVTIDEFSKILDQLYAKGYVLVDFDSFILESEGEDGKITYSTQPIFLPDGKKPLMLTETLVNYETFSIDSDGDGEADKGGDGFASKLVVDDNGNIVNEYVDANGNTVYGAYDLVPILENFIKEHPDFSYQGARATLAVTGEDGVFGYRIMNSVKEKKGEDYYNSQVEGAKKIAAALREAGYTIACYTYANVSYGQLSATKIEVDLDNWKKEVKPVLGDVPILVYAKASDISADGNYEGGKYNVLRNAGFRYFVSSGNSPYAEVTVNYVRQSRIMVTGQQMIAKPDMFSNYFNVKEVLNNQRGK